MTNEDRAGWVGFWVGVLLTLTLVVAFLPHPSEAHGVGQKCETEEYIKIPYRYAVEDGHVHYACVHPDDYVSAFNETYYRNPAVYSSVKGSVCEHRRFWKRQVGITIMAEACD